MERGNDVKDFESRITESAVDFASLEVHSMFCFAGTKQHEILENTETVASLQAFTRPFVVRLHKE